FCRSRRAFLSARIGLMPRRDKPNGLSRSAATILSHWKRKERMRPGNNTIEECKAGLGGDGLRIRAKLPELIERGHESLTTAEKDLLKWVGVFFRKPTPGQFMMRIRMPNGFAASEQLHTIAEV